jgi:hypothetical protein
MGLEEFFEYDRRDYRNNGRNRYPDNDDYSDNSQYPLRGRENAVKWQNILEKIRSNSRYRFFIISAGLLILAIVVFLIIILFPLLVKFINYISQNGLQGVINEIAGFLDKILNGTAN